MSSLELPAGKTSAFVISFDFDAEEVWLAENPENANRPGVLSQGTYGAKVGLGLVLDVLDHLGLPATFFTPGRVAERYPDQMREIVAHGHELGHGITTLQANLEWVVSWTKGEFIGRAALAQEKQDGVARVLRGIATEGRRPPRAECNVVANGKVIGVVTSGNYSPILEHGISLALVEPSYKVGDVVAIDVRGSELPGRIVELPFVAKK